MASFPSHETLADVERNHILHTLALCEGNRTRAAKALGISIRCLRIKLHQYSEDGHEVPHPAAGIEHEPMRVTCQGPLVSEPAAQESEAEALVATQSKR